MNKRRREALVTGAVVLAIMVTTVIMAGTIRSQRQEIQKLRGALMVERLTPNCVEVEIRTDPAWPQVEAISRIHQVPTDLARPVVEAALAHGLDPYVFARLVSMESSWRPSAVSEVGAIGLTQVLPSTALLRPARGLHGDSTVEGISAKLLDPWFNAYTGAWYYRRMLDRYDGDHFQALRAYNAGPTRIARDDLISRNYATRILEGT